MSESQGQSNSYIPEIDGLRAIAVLSVVIYHVNEKILPGGFTGVDIFFVISGYVITQSLYAKFSTSFIEYISGFYRRRLLRIAPALIVCLSFTAIVSSLFIPEAWISRNNDATGFAAFYGLSNFVLVENIDGYFNASIPFNPFVHTWSLAVEEQFYVIFPILIFLVIAHSIKQKTDSRNESVFSYSLLALAVLSLLFSAFESQAKPSHAFYLLPSRFWELAVGALIYQLKVSGVQPPNGRKSTWLLPLFGFALLAAGFSYSDSSKFPFPWAILPVAGTALLIFSFDPKSTCSNPVTSFLKLPSIIFIGLISYSLYLWHWPILVMFRWTTGIENSFWLVICLATIFLCSMFSYFFVELPLRRNTFIVSRRNGVVIAGGVVCIVLASWISSITFNRPWVFNQSVTTKDSMWSSNVSSKELENLDPIASFPIDRKIFVIGDSHTGAYRKMLNLLSDRLKIEVISYKKSGCNVLNLIGPTPDKDYCRNHIEKLFVDLEESASPGDIVFFASLRAYRLGNQDRYYTVSELANSRDSHHAVNKRRMALEEAKNYINKMEDLGLSILIDTPKPVFRSPPFRCSDWFNKSNPVCETGFNVSRDFLQTHNQPALDSIFRLKAEYPQLWIWDPFPILCPGVVCSAFSDNFPLFSDGDHLTGYGNVVLYPSFEEKIIEILSTQGTGSFEHQLDMAD